MSKQTESQDTRVSVYSDLKRVSWMVNVWHDIRRIILKSVRILNEPLPRGTLFRHLLSRR